MMKIFAGLFLALAVATPVNAEVRDPNGNQPMKVMRVQLGKENYSFNLGYGVEDNAPMVCFRQGSLVLDAGASKTRINFPTLNPVPLKHFNLKAGPTDIKVNGLGNSNFEDFSFEGGAGRYFLDFGGDYKKKGKVKLLLGIGEVTVVVPKKIGIRLVANGSLLSNLSLPDFIKTGKDRSPNYGTADGTIDFDIHCGLGSSLQLRWR
ncbi:MAG TPA: hypothetical protein DD435_03960 [Cyanobacteria bacterium UBA8530]|nr:hypothetical protein [Cyanobacteria bacterium UBA8530]